MLTLRCFVIQPFDGDTYDRRYDSIIAPAIEEAGLKPYRVDRNPATDVPADEIETGIREATVCLADISDDNPNVWYEVGYAFACRKRVCLISTKRSAPRPFDIRNHAVIEYLPEAEGELGRRIVYRLKAMMEDTSAIHCEGQAVNLKELLLDGQIEDPPFESSYELSSVAIARVANECRMTGSLHMKLGDFEANGPIVAQGPIRNGYLYFPYECYDEEKHQGFSGVGVLHLANIGDLRGFWLSESLTPGSVALGRFVFQRSQKTSR